MEFFPDHPDEMGLEAKGNTTPSQYRRFSWMMSRGLSVPGVEVWKRQGLRFEAQWSRNLTQRAIALIFKTAPITPILSIYLMGLVEVDIDGGHGMSGASARMVSWVKNSLDC